MDYEKKYKEALERAKKLYEQGTITESLGYVFPELKESKDERIRKTLIEYIKGIKSWNYFLGISKGQMIAWLEKQAEKKALEPSRLMHPYAKQYKVMSAYEIGFIEGAVWADAHPDIDVRTMAAWQSGYKEAIEKACEWLYDHLYTRRDEQSPTNHFVCSKQEMLTQTEFVEQFRKAMEGGEE